MEWINTIAACTKATALLKEQAAAGSPLAVDLEGIFEDTGGESELCVVQVAAQERPTFLFDITALGSLAFMDGAGGLRALLEDGEVVKLLFDARLDADVLHRQFGVALANVYDLQILYSCASEVSQYLTGMARVFDRLTMLPAGLRAQISEAKRLGKVYFDPDAGGSLHVWRARPLPLALQHYAAIDTKVLFIIQQQWRNVLPANELEHLSRRRLQLAIRHQRMSAIRDFPLPMERRTLFVAGVSAACGEQGLCAHFGSFGDLEQVHLEGILACVIFADKGSAQAALAAGNKQVGPGGSRLTVDRPHFVKDLVADYYGAPGWDEEMWQVPFGNWFGSGWALLDWSSLPRLPEETSLEDTCSTTSAGDEDEIDAAGNVSICKLNWALRMFSKLEVADVFETSESGETSTAASDLPRKKKSRKQHWLERRRAQRRQTQDPSAAVAANKQAQQAQQFRQARRVKTSAKAGTWVAVTQSAETSPAAKQTQQVKLL